MMILLWIGGHVAGSFVLPSSFGMEWLEKYSGMKQIKELQSTLN